MKDPRIEQAAYNNAAWCDTVCRAHGSPGEFLEGVWINRYKTPPFFPNGVTLTRDRGPAGPLARVRELVEARIPGEWAIKDSYCALDLSSLGFRILFEPDWIGRLAPSPRPGADASQARWARVATAAELVEWEMAWRGDPAGGVPPGQAPIFPPILLRDENVAVFAAYQGRRIVAGGIACRTAEVVGLSNLFVPAHERERFRAGCLAVVMDAFPGLPLVGYEAGQDLVEMLVLGFEVLGPLRIWVRAAT